MNRRSFTLALLVVAAGSLLVWLLMGCPRTGIDDADIFFVYAKHFAEGHGFVYNIGGERVEGFTSMLWTLICAGFFRLFERIEIPLFLLNLLLGSAAVWVCLRRVERPGIFLVLLAAVPAWFAWSQVTLMETGLWGLLLTLIVLSVVERRALRVALLLPLLVLARPESMLWGAWSILMLGMGIAAADGWRKACRGIVVPGLSFAATLAALVAFRLRYFGYPVPNTYYAKVSPNLAYDLWHGLLYLLGYCFSNPVVLIVGAIWLSVAVRGIRRWRSGMDGSALLALCLLPGFGIPVLVGGDHFGAHRFYQPIWPLLCLLAAGAWPSLPERFHTAKARKIVAVVLPCIWILFPLTSRLRHEFRIARDGRETGAMLEAMFCDMDEYPSVATITAGGSKYAYPGTVLDLMGLNSTEMAHAPGRRTGYKNHTAFNKEVFHSWQPDILLCGEDAQFDARVLKGLPSDERFKRMYVKMALQRNGREVNAYYSFAFLEQVHQAGR